MSQNIAKMNCLEVISPNLHVDEDFIESHYEYQTTSVRRGTQGQLQVSIAPIIYLRLFYPFNQRCKILKIAPFIQDRKRLPGKATADDINQQSFSFPPLLLILDPGHFSSILLTQMNPLLTSWSSHLVLEDSLSKGNYWWHQKDCLFCCLLLPIKTWTARHEYGVS